MKDIKDEIQRLEDQLKQEKKSFTTLLASLVIGCIGIYILVHHGSWEIALGVFMFIWANNLSTKN